MRSYYLVEWKDDFSIAETLYKLINDKKIVPIFFRHRTDLEWIKCEHTKHTVFEFKRITGGKQFKSGHYVERDDLFAILL